MTVDDTGLDFDPTPSGYEQLYAERTPDRITHCYRYGDREISLYYRKEEQRLAVECELLHSYPWVIDRQVVDPYQFDTAQLATFLEKAIGLQARIEAWKLVDGLPRILVDPEAGVVVTDLHGNVMETLVPTAAVEPP